MRTTKSKRGGNDKFRTKSTNICATAILKNPKNVTTYCTKLRNIPAYKYRGDRGTILLYPTGRVICVGNPNKKICKKNIVELAKLLDSKMRRFYITNCVFSGDMKQKICLEKAFKNLQCTKSLELELFPALTANKGNIHIKIFANGKFYVTGSKKKKDMQEFLTTVLLTCVQKEHAKKICEKK